MQMLSCIELCILCMYNYSILDLNDAKFVEKCSYCKKTIQNEAFYFFAKNEATEVCPSLAMAALAFSAAGGYLATKSLTLNLRSHPL